MTAIPTPARQERPSQDDEEPPTKLDPLVEASLLQHGKALGTFQESHDRLVVETVRVKAGLSGVKRSVDALAEAMRTSSREVRAAQAQTQETVLTMASKVDALMEGLQNLTAFVKQLVGKG